MKAKMVKFRQPATVVGGGELSRSVLEDALALAPAVIAADGAADRLTAVGVAPDAVIGDMDSLSCPEHWKETTAEFLRIEEQDSTDFEKCLYATDAPFYLAVGFTGRRMDHSLAALHVMLARPEKQVALLGEHDVIVPVPGGREIILDLPDGAVVSFFPLAPATGIKSQGLRWSIDGLRMEAGQQIGTSNQASGGPVRFAFDRDGVFLMIASEFLGQIVELLSADASEV